MLVPGVTPAIPMSGGSTVMYHSVVSHTGPICIIYLCCYMSCFDVHVYVCSALMAHLTLGACARVTVIVPCVCVCVCVCVRVCVCVTKLATT